MKRVLLVLVLCTMWSVCVPGRAQEPPGEYLRLETAIALAKQHNGQLKMAAHKVAQAEAKLKEARSALWPQFDAMLGYTATDAEPMSISIPGMPPITLQENTPYTTQFSLSQPLFVDPLRVQCLLAEKSLEISRLEYEETLELVTYNVTNAYYQVIKAGLGREIAQRSLAQAEANLRMTQAQFTAGFLAKNQVLQVELAVANTRQTLLRMGNLEALALAGLRMLIGAEPGSALKVPASLDAAPSAEYEKVALEVDRRYDTRKARLAADMAGLAVRMANSGYYPIATMSLGYLVRGDQPSLAGGTASITIGVKWSYALGGKTAATVKAAEEDQARAEEAFKLCQESAKFEIIQSQLEWQEAGQRVQLTAMALAVARENLRLATKRYELGAGTPQEATDAPSQLGAGGNERSERPLRSFPERAQTGQSLGPVAPNKNLKSGSLEKRCEKAYYPAEAQRRGERDPGKSLVGRLVFPLRLCASARRIVFRVDHAALDRYFESECRSWIFDGFAVYVLSRQSRS